MKADKLSEALGMVDDELIAEADEGRTVPKRAGKRPIWVAFGSIAACAVIAAGVAFGLNRGLIGTENSGSSETSVTDSGTGESSGQNSAADEAVVKYLADYPDMPKVMDFFEVIDNYTEADGDYDEWRDKKEAEWKYSREKLKRFQMELYNHPDYEQGLDSFFKDSTGLYLSEADGENVVYSPTNVYMALAMLAETTGGSTRRQILDAVGVDSMEQLRNQANAVWEIGYCDNGDMISVMGNSVWLSSDMEYNKETIQALALNYYASAFSGKMGSGEMNELLHDWLNEQTRGLLSEQVEGVTLYPETVMSLFSTLYFKAKWCEGEGFYEELTKPQTFYLADGTEIQCDFMKNDAIKDLYIGDNFTMINIGIDLGVILGKGENGSMWLALPNEGVTAEQLSADSELLDFIYGDGSLEQKTYDMTIEVPKFDAASTIDLAEGLNKLGITDVFGSGADFSPLTDNAEGLKLDRAKHSARVRIDERGIEGAAFTELGVDGAAPDDFEKIDFTLDRPFLFFVTGNDDLPMFAGVINKP